MLMFLPEGSPSLLLLVLRRWEDAEKYYGKAVGLAPGFSFAAANRALAMFQLGESDASIRYWPLLACQLLGASQLLGGVLLCIL
jgi:tetratricopeptide (TPR) repeat protein